MYNKVDTNLNFVDREKQVREFWKDNDIFQIGAVDCKFQRCG